MYLTRMALNPARRGTRFLLGSPQRMHAAVLSAFPPDTPVETPAGRVLWRVDRNVSSLLLYISSPSVPDLTHLVEQAGWPLSSTAPWSTVAVGSLHERLAEGQRWVFRLTANPVHNVGCDAGKRGKRYGHVTVAQQEKWLRDRSRGWGFEVVSAGVVDRRRLTFARRSDGAARQVTISTATFDGLLRVTDPVALRSALTAGVGRAKAYGCGLLTLAPAP